MLTQTNTFTTPIPLPTFTHPPTTPTTRNINLAADRVRNGEPTTSEIVTRYQDDGVGLPLLVILSNYSVRKAQYRDRDVYHVEEFPAPEGRAFLLHRTEEAIESNPDRTERTERYGVLIANGQDHICECRGHLAHGRCKHVDSLRALLAGGHIDHPLNRPEPPVTPDSLVQAPF
jgi:hypothetical protein